MKIRANPGFPYATIVRMSEKKFKCTFPGCDRDAAFIRHVCELVPRPFSMKESDVRRKPPFGELMREFIVKCPDHGERYVQAIGHHISTIPKKSKKGK
jgi:hypothetical protein